MKLPIGGLVTWLALAIVLTIAARQPHAALSPAALTRSHAALERDCLACHALGRGVPEARCVKCHPVARIGLFDTQGAPIAKPNVKASFHQRLQETRCLACHAEHPGSKGAEAHAGFTHAMLASGDRDDCAACHAAPLDALHRDVGGACATCHSTERWKPASFDHAKYWPLDRRHQATCVTCHPGNTYAKYTCWGCHEHTPASVAREHEGEVRGDVSDCVRCHRSARDHEGGEHGGREGRGEHAGHDD